MTQRILNSRLIPIAEAKHGQYGFAYADQITPASPPKQTYTAMSGIISKAPDGRPIFWSEKWGSFRNFEDNRLGLQLTHWASAEPMFTEPPHEDSLAGLLSEMLAYEAKAFENDTEVDGADLVDEYCNWRDRMRKIIRNGDMRLDVIAKPLEITVMCQGGMVTEVGANQHRAGVIVTVVDLDTDGEVDESRLSINQEGEVAVVTTYDLEFADPIAPQVWKEAQ